jgi:hypothetical protein
MALALRVSGSATGLRRWLPGLWLVGVILAGFLVAEPAARLLLNRGNRPTRLFTALSEGTAIGDYLPTLTHASSREARLAVVWIVGIGVLLVLDRLAATRPRIDRAFSSFALAVAALLVLGVVIDLAVVPAASLPAVPVPDDVGGP